MSGIGTWKPGNPGDLQPWRSKRGSSDFPQPRVCERYEAWTGHLDPVLARDTTPRGYGYPAETCAMCGHIHPEPSSHSSGTDRSTE